MTNPEDPRTQKFDRSADQQGPQESADGATEVHHTSDPYQAYGYVPDEQPTAAYQPYPGWDPNAGGAQPTQAFPTYQGGQYPQDPNAEYPPTEQQAWGQAQPHPGQPYQAQPYGTQPYPGQPYPGQQNQPTQQWGGYPGEAPPLDQNGGQDPKKPKMWIFALVGLVALALIVGAVAMFSGGKNDSSSTASGTTTDIFAPPLPSEPSAAPRTKSPRPSGQPGEVPALPPEANGDAGTGAGAAVGSIDSNDGSTLTVSDISGGKTTVHTDQNTSVVALSGGKVSDLKVGDTVVIQGSKSADGSLMAKLIISTSMPHGGFGN